MGNSKKTQRISQKERNKKSNTWYKEQINSLDVGSSDEKTFSSFSASSKLETRNMKINYDLYNDILDVSDFEYICTPFGSEVGELPAKMVNRDIISSKIKVVLGMESKRAFNWKVVATNPEATTRQETEEMSRIKQYIIDSIMQPIRERVQQEEQAKLKGRELTQEEQVQIQQEIQAQIESQTPQETKRYMKREHQDPVEVMSHQLLEYLTQKLDLKKKFNKALLHSLLSARGVMYVGILNDEPQVWNVNSLWFNFDKSPDNEYIEDGEWASCEYRMTPSEIVNYFGKDLKDDEIDAIYEYWAGFGEVDDSSLFDLYEKDENDVNNKYIKVLHGVWKSLRKIGFLTYLDEQGEEQLTLVDEKYKLNTERGDVSIEWEHIPEVHETWKIKIGEPIYLQMRPIPGQFKDLDNLHRCKLPYYGVVVDNLNSKPTALMDRLKVYQYYYNIVMYRLELILASDKGKKVLMNINAIPDSAGIDIEKWQYFFESTPFMWFDPNEEGSGYNDVNTIAKTLDMSLISDIGKYIELAEYLKGQAGESVGISKQMEGQVSQYESVRNTQQVIQQNSYIIELYYELHNHLKKNVLEALLETSKMAYANKKQKKLVYVLDDMSKEFLNLDVGLLDNSTLGLFISDSSKTEEIKSMLRQLTHAALQNQKVELSDVISVMKQESIVEAEETLKVAEDNRKEQDLAIEDKRNQGAEKIKKLEIENADKARQHEIAKIDKEYNRKEKLEIIKSSIMGASFNPDMDKDNDGVNDFLEIAKHGLNADIQNKKLDLDRDKLEHTKEMDKIKLKNDKKKLEIEDKKVNSKGK